MSEEQITKIVNQLDDIGRSDLADKFKNAEDKLQYIKTVIAPILEDQEMKYTDKYSSIEDFIGDRNSRLSKLYKDMNGKKPGKARMTSFLDKNPDISEQDVNAWFDKTNQYKEDYKKEREYEAGRYKREKEVKDLPWYKDVFTSDYSKQRYIDDPTTSILGGSQFNPYSSEGQSEIRDAILGATAGATDIVPTPLLTHLWAGPAIRTGRDIQHEVNDEAYKPEGTSVFDYTKRFGKDVAANTLFEYTPNWLARGAGRLNKGAGASLNKYIAQPYNAYKLGEEEALIKNSYDTVDKLLKSDITPLEMYNEIKALPESEYKQDLLRNINVQRGSIPAQIQHQHNAWTRQLDPSAQQAFAILRNNGINVKSVGPYAKQPSDFFLRKATAPTLNKGQFIISKLMEAGGKVGVPSTKPLIRPEIKVTNNDRTQIDWFKDNYARDWELGFTPEYNEADPKWKAFEELYPERAMEIKYKELHK
jgi:hypothetical protein